MAKVTNAFDTYTATADREQLSDVIYNISPTATPVMSAIGRNNVKNVQFDWQVESLPAASATGKLEGFELSRAASTATTRVSNVCQIEKYKECEDPDPDEIQIHKSNPIPGCTIITVKIQRQQQYGSSKAK